MKYVYTYFKAGIYTVSAVQLSLLVLMFCGVTPWYYAILPVFFIIAGMLYTFTVTAISVYSSELFDRSEMNNGGFIKTDEDAKVFVDNLTNPPEPNDRLNEAFKIYKPRLIAAKIKRLDFLKDKDVYNLSPSQACELSELERDIQRLELIDGVIVKQHPAI